MTGNANDEVVHNSSEKSIEFLKISLDSNILYKIFSKVRNSLVEGMSLKCTHCLKPVFIRVGLVSGR